MSSSVTTYVALLRGINVGGKNLLPMKDLAAIFAEQGASDVRTYIQSGNVVFRAASSDAERLAERVSAQIQARHAHRPPIVLRTSDELRAVVRGNPFAGREALLHVAFLDASPAPARLAVLDPQRSPGDAFHVADREIYLHLPKGVGRTKLTNAYFDAKLGVTTTVRNWRTVVELVSLSTPS